MNFLFVALGGAVGAMARYAISLIPLKTEFPFLTLITNVIGAILIGFIVGITSGRDGVSKIWFCFGRPAYAVALPRFLHFRWNPIIYLNIITACLDADMWC